MGVQSVEDRSWWVGSRRQAPFKSRGGGKLLEQELKREGLDSPVGEEKHKAQMLHWPKAWGFLPAKTPGFQRKGRMFAG